MISDINLRSLLDRFIELESKKSFFDILINDVFLWRYIRFDIYDSLCIKYHFCNKKPSYRYVEKNKLSPEQIEFKCTSGNVKNACQRDVLIVPHGRRFYENKGYYRCIYTDLLSKRIDESYYLLDYGDVFRGFLPIRDINRLFFDIAEWKETYSIQGKTDRRLEEGILENRIIRPVEDFFDVSFTFNKICDIKRTSWFFISEYQVYKEYFRWILNIIRPKVVIIVCYYSFIMMTLCEVCKEKKIPVVELQHGIINDMHVSYNFKNGGSFEWFPDYIFTYGDFAKKARFPIDKDKIKSVGFPELESKINTIQKHKIKKILFISSIKIELAFCADSLSKLLNNENYELIYKLHPLEIKGWRSKYAGLFDENNIFIDDSMNKTIYDYFNEVDWVIGVSSTSLYEATVFPVRIAIMSVADYQLLSELYSNGFAYLFENAEELQRLIQEEHYACNDSNNYFKMNALENMINELHIIMNGGLI